MSEPRSTGALDDIVVADFSRVLAGPYATMLLGDLGAEVIKIERPGSGDDTRQWGPPHDSDGVATYFNSVNRNKRSVAIDLATEDGRGEAFEIATRADVVIENFRAGTMERLGLGYDAIRVVNPGVIYCSITGFGRAEGAVLPGYDLLVQAVGGLMSVTGPDADTPTKAGVALVDVLTGTHALTGILAALHHRDRTGEGQRVDLDLMSVMLSSLVNQASAHLGAGVIPHAMGNRHPSIAPYEVFDTADRPIALAVGNDRQFGLLAEEIGAPELTTDPRFATNPARVAHREELWEIVSGRLRTDTADSWFERLSARGVPAGPINDVSEALAFAEKFGLEPLVDVPGSATPQVRNPITLSRTPATYRSAPPGLGSN